MDTVACFNFHEHSDWLDLYLSILIGYNKLSNFREGKWEHLY